MNTRRFLIIGVSVLAGALALNFGVRQARLHGGITGHTTSSGAKVSVAERSLRPNYPYSVIPGGAYSPAELRVANEKDTVVRDHYAGFNLHAVQLVTLTADRYQYVSFRMNNRVFWTHKKLRIPKGAILLTDGSNYARTRCGNRLSSTPQANTTPLEPSAELLSMPPFTTRLLPQIPSMAEPLAMVTQTPAPVGASRFTPPILPVTPVADWPPVYNFPPVVPITPGFLPPPVGTPPIVTTTPPPVVVPPIVPIISSVPEPASLYLLALGLCLAFWFVARIVRRRTPRGPSKADGS